MAFRQQGEEPLTADINFRLTERQKHDVEEQASAAGMTRSAYARACTLRLPVVARGDLQAVNQLRQLGGLLKVALGLSGPDQATEIQRVLSRIEELVVELLHGLSTARRRRQGRG